MAKKVEFELDINGLRELMKGPEMQAVLQEAGDAVASGAGGESERVGGGRERGACPAAKRAGRGL